MTGLNHLVLRTMPLHLALLAVIAFSAPANAVVSHKSAPKVIPFTQSQADKGALLFQAKCSACHGSGLRGAAGPALIGPSFTTSWYGKKISQFFDVISQSMPRNAPGSLKVSEYYQLTAFVLSKNGFPAGATALSGASDNVTLLGAKMTSAPTPGPIPPLPAPALVFGHATTSAPDAAELRAPRPGDWLMVNRDYRGDRYSPLTQINTTNAVSLAPVCVQQLGMIGAFSSTPVAYKGILYVTARNTTWALNATTCRTIWKYHYITDEQAIVSFNRGVALYHGMVYRTTPTGHLIALDMKTGKLIWEVWVSSVRKGYWLSVAPVVYDGRVFVGEAGADSGAPGHLYAFNSATGKLLWKFDDIPSADQPGADTWQAGAKHGGGSNWSSYSIDTSKNLIYASVGNPAPDYLSSARRGANLYTDSVVAVNTTTGKLNWYAQQIANDDHDWDTAAAPALYNQGTRSYMAVATKGGWLFIYNRKSHRLVAKVPVSTHLNSNEPVTAKGVYTCPGTVGGVEWNGPAYSPQDRMLFVGSVGWCGTYKSAKIPFKEGALNMGGTFTFDPVSKAVGWIRGFDAATGRQKWVYKAASPVVAGVTPTAGGVLFSGDMAGNFLTLDAKTGKILYRFYTGGPVAGGVSTYTVGGRQYVAVASGNASETWSGEGSPSVLIFAVSKH